MSALRATRRRRRAAACLASALVTLACTDGGGDDGGDGAASTTTSVAAVTTEPRVDDGEFVVGLITPVLGPGADIGQSIRAAVTLAAADVNEAGGIDGQRVRIVRRDEGDGPADALRAVQDLVDVGVDAIIGPTSSLNLLGSLGAAVDSGVLTCAPTASALALDEFPDEGLLLRTAPSDSLQALALAQLVDESGAESAAVLYLDDPYGRPLAEEVRAALVAQGTAVLGDIGFTESEDDIAEAAAAVARIAPPMVVVVADAGAGPLVIDAIESRSTTPRPAYVVTDTMRQPGTPDEPFTGSVASRVEGASPAAYADARFFTDQLADVDESASGIYAANAFDCLNLIALAGEASGSTDPAVIAAAIPAVSTGGTTCASFSRCVEAVDEGRNINYDSPAGPLDIGPDGDPSKAVFQRFTFDIFGGDVSGRTLTVSSG